LIREDFDLASLFLQYRAVIWSEEENDFVPIDVWLNPNAYDGEGLTIRDTEGVITPISVENNGEGFIDIYLPRAVGLTKVNFRAGVRSMTTFMGVPCAGASDSFFGEASCVPNIETYYGIMTTPEGIESVVLNGSLNTAYFLAPSPLHPFNLGYLLRWHPPVERWQVDLLGEELPTLIGATTTRCQAAGVFTGSPEWSAIISASPPP
jgi:hypothetical protein